MTNRRSFITTLLAVGAYSVSRPLWAAPNTTHMSVTTPIYKQVKLWKDTPPGGGGPVSAPIITRGGAIRNIATPVLDVYVPANPNGAAMLIAPGGGYTRIAVKYEAMPAVQWLNARGVIACILHYRLPSEGWNVGPLAPLQDAQRAIRLMRSGTICPQIEPKRIGLLGFSSGGHLMGMAATCSQFQSYQPIDNIDKLSTHAMVSVLAYPVITLKPPYDKTSTRRALIGKNPTPKQINDWSVETHVNKTCPPTFLVHGANDTISNPINTLIMQQACEKVGVPVERHVLSQSGHGFSMGKKGTPTQNWPNYLEPWLHKYMFL